MKSAYVKPIMKVEEFVANEYVAVCLTQAQGGGFFWHTTPVCQGASSHVNGKSTTVSKDIPDDGTEVTEAYGHYHSAETGEAVNNVKYHTWDFIQVVGGVEYKTARYNFSSNIQVAPTNASM